MADDGNGRAEAVEAPRGIHSLLSSPDRDFLVRNNGDQVKIYTLKGKKIGLYFSASWCGPCQRFTPVLAEAYSELSTRGEFEIVFISADKDDESFSTYFSKMPWLAVPFSDKEKRDGLDQLLEARKNGIPHLVILDDTGKVLTDSGVKVVSEHGVEGYPFTPEHIKELEDKEEKCRKNQSLASLLVRGSRDFVTSSAGERVPVSDLEGKMVGLYFALSKHKLCVDFLPKLTELHEELKSKGEDFEIVLIPLDDDEETFKQTFGRMPWFALPVKDKQCRKLVRYFELSALPTLVIIGSDGKTLHSNVAEAVEEHGMAAYPFTPEKFAELAEIEKAREAAQTLQSILVSGDLDFVIGKDEAKTPVSDLVGKTVLLYFSAHWCPPCLAFLPVFIKAYQKIKAKDDAFEVIFISSDNDQASFNNYFSEMPWLALPFGDQREKSLIRKFKVRGIPTLVAIGPTGQTVTKEARDLIMEYGADAYPFTADHLKKLEVPFEEMIKGWPKKLKHPLHEEHEIVPARRKRYGCDGCGEAGVAWSYCCDECDFDLHPKCAVAEDKAQKDEANEEPPENEASKGEGKEEGEKKGGVVCDGEVCYKA